MVRKRRSRGFAPDNFKLNSSEGMDKTLMRSKTVETLMNLMIQLFKSNKLLSKDTKTNAYIAIGYWTICKELEHRYNWKDSRNEQVKDIIKIGKERIEND
jgi:hypothetical protein